MIRHIFLVAKQVYKTKFKSIGFWSLVLSPLLVALISFLVIFLVSMDKSPARLAVVDNPNLSQYLDSSKSLKNTKVSNVGVLVTAKKDLSMDKIDAYLVEKDKEFELVASTDGTVKFDETAVKSILSQYETLKKAKELHLNAKDIAYLESSAKVSLKTVDKKGDEGKGGDSAQAYNYAISYFLGVATFMLLAFYVGMIAQEIANEKSSRIMEILLAATGAKVQYYGKIIGVFALALTQVGLYLISFGILSIFFKDNTLIKKALEIMNGVDKSFFFLALIMTLIAIFGYLVLASIVASLVNDQSQAQQAAQPVIYIAMIGYISTFVVSSVPNNPVIKILSYVPFISQSLMPARLSIRSASMNEALIALGLEIVGIFLVTMQAEKIYEKNVLSYSDDKVYKQLLSMFKK